MIVFFSRIFFQQAKQCRQNRFRYTHKIRRTLQLKDYSIVSIIVVSIICLSLVFVSFYDFRLGCVDCKQVVDSHTLLRSSPSFESLFYVYVVDMHRCSCLINRRTCPIYCVSGGALNPTPQSDRHALVVGSKSTYHAPDICIYGLSVTTQ